MIRTKTIITTFMTLLFVITIVSCQQEPTARFVTDKSEYIAGETVHLTNTSSDGSSFQWTMPDGQTLNTNNADYLINVNDSFETLTFKLEAFSKNGKKTSSESKDVAVIPSSVFYVNNFEVRPLIISEFVYRNNYYIAAKTSNASISWWCTFILPGTTVPILPSTYNLQSNDTLTSGQAVVEIDNIYDAELDFDKFVSLSGQLLLTINHGKLQFEFDNVDAERTSEPVGTHPNVRISGNITCH